MLFLKLALNFLNHRRDIIHADLGKREVPILLWVALQVDMLVPLTVAHSTIVGQPDVVASLPKLDRDWEARSDTVSLREPGVGGHIDTMVQQDSLLNEASWLHLN